MTYDYKILLADDDDALRTALGEFLSRLGFGVIEAVDGPSALATALGNRIDFSILDVHMPGMTGLEILTELREARCRDAGPLPCILISAAASQSERRAALQRGAFRFLSKPFAVDSLVECVGELLRTFDPGPSGERMIARLACGLSGTQESSGLPAPLDQLLPFFPFFHRPPDDTPSPDTPSQRWPGGERLNPDQDPRGTE
ncbi:MAG: hypothetical protein CMJ85_01525 [Planctomycetes bacterium]|nr:hypothetical protein [Planctomycetota bacterium]MDP6424059.1 response regulator [Planctomycetota bacterium]